MLTLTCPDVLWMELFHMRVRGIQIYPKAQTRTLDYFFLTHPSPMLSMAIHLLFSLLQQRQYLKLGINCTLGGWTVFDAPYIELEREALKSTTVLAASPGPRGLPFKDTMPNAPVIRVLKYSPQAPLTNWPIMLGSPAPLAALLSPPYIEKRKE